MGNGAVFPCYAVFVRCKIGVNVAVKHAVRYFIYCKPVNERIYFAGTVFDPNISVKRAVTDVVFINGDARCLKSRNACGNKRKIPVYYAVVDCTFAHSAVSDGVYFAEFTVLFIIGEIKQKRLY